MLIHMPSSSWKGAEVKGGNQDWQAKRRSNAKFEGLNALTVAEARELRGRTSADAVRKQEEVRELVGSRYSDFIDAADTISNMRTSAHHILDTAAILQELSKKLVTGAWLTSANERASKSSSGWAGDASVVLRTSEDVHAAIDAHNYLSATRHLLRGRALFASLKASPLPAVATWREIPYVRQQLSSLISPSLSNAIVSAAQSFLGGSMPEDAGQAAAPVADALAAVALVKSLSLRDTLDLFLEARAACASALCKQLSTAVSDAHSDTLLHDMCKLRTCLGQTVETAFALFASAEKAVQGDSNVTGALLVKLLSSVHECDVRSDMVREVSRDDCASWCSHWVKTQSAAVRASSRAGLQAIPSGQALAAIEASLRKHSNHDARSDSAWTDVAGADPWNLLFAEAFSARAKQVVHARFGDIQIEPLIETSLEALAHSSHHAGTSTAAATTTTVPRSHSTRDDQSPGGRAVADLFFKARLPAGLSDAENQDNKTRTHPWETLSNNSGAQFLSQLHAAVLDCHGLVLSATTDSDSASKGEVGKERLLLVQESCKEAVTGLASLLLAKCQALQAKHVGGDHGQAVAQAMYLSQCAVTVRRHLRHLLERLAPAAQQEKGREDSNADLIDELTGLLDKVRCIGHGMWVDWVALQGRKELDEGIKSLEKESFWRSADDIVRRWEEVDVQMESETGEARSDRVPVPACALAPTFSMLFNACSSVHQVVDPPLGTDTLQQLATKLAVATVETYEKVPPCILRLSDRMCIQLLFDFTFTMDVLAGHTADGLASRIERVEDALSSPLDPIDWSFQQPLVAASRARAYQRASVVMGPLVQLKRLHLRAATAQSSLPKPINILPLVAPQQRFGLLPAVDAWTYGAEGGKKEGRIGEDDRERSPAAGEAVWSQSPADVGEGTQRSSHLGRFGTYFGQQVAKGWAGLG